MFEGSIGQQGMQAIILIIASLVAILGLFCFLLWFSWKKEKIRANTSDEKPVKQLPAPAAERNNET